MVFYCRAEVMAPLGGSLEGVNGCIIPLEGLAATIDPSNRVESDSDGEITVGVKQPKTYNKEIGNAHERSLTTARRARTSASG